MKLKLKRYSDDGDSTLGLFYIDGKFVCYTLEDESREVKVKGETCIPEGTYNVIYQDTITPMTERYRDKYDWFDKHLMLDNVPGFSTIYIHIGNDDSATDGCLLLGDSAISNVTKDGFIGSSKNAFRRNYKTICDALNSDISVSIEVSTIK